MPKNTPAAAVPAAETSADWQLQEAKARFSELFRRAREAGPQRVTRHGKSSVIVVREEEYLRLARTATRQGTLAEFFARSPLAGVDLKLTRPRDYGRKIEL